MIIRITKKLLKLPEESGGETRERAKFVIRNNADVSGRRPSWQEANVAEE